MMEMKTVFTSLLGVILALLVTSIFAQYQMENITRAVVAVDDDAGVYVGWRLLGTDPDTIAFNVYRDDTKLNTTPITNSTNYLDEGGTTSDTYHIIPVLGGVEQTSSDTVGVWNQNYLTVPLQIPPGGTTPDAVSYTYSANDCSVGDLDGDGEYEIVLKWDPSNSKDNSQSGYTGDCILDAYEMDGTHMWRIDLGINIRAGAHYTQFMVYDLDGDGKAEIACKTAPGTKDGSGNYLSLGPAAGADHLADYRNSSGYILSGPEYFTIFDGETGYELATTDYIPPRGNVGSWGDSYGNRVDRFLAAIAYLDGSEPSVVMCRGYYTRTVLAAWDWREGTLTNRWIFDSDNGYPTYAGQGNHNLSVADVDNDGKQEIIYGSMAVDDDGTGLWNSGLGHGDAMHVSDIDPERPGLEVWGIHENAQVGSALLDAATGDIIWGTGPGDVGRGVSANLVGSQIGMECWGGTSDLRTCTNLRAGDYPPSQNHVVWWDGDLLRELLDDINIRKYGGDILLLASGCASNNGSKANPALQADLFGDWREEVIWRTSNNTALRIYTTTDITQYRLTTLMHDPTYRMAIAWQNVAYNQPPHTGYYVGPMMFIPDSLWPPSAPRNLTSEDFNERVRLFWDPNVEVDLEGYNLYRSKAEEGPFSMINDTLLTTEFYLDTLVLNDTSYYYYVTAIDTAGNESDPSNIHLARPTYRPDYPTGIFTRSDSRANLIVWNEVNEDDIVGYNIYRSLNALIDFTKLNTEVITETYYEDSTTSSGIMYYYYVVSVNDVEIESFSSEVVTAQTGDTYTTQAEDEVMGGVVYLENEHIGYNGTGYVNFESSGSSVTFNYMPGFDGGEYALVYRYALGNTNRTGSLIVNDNTQSLTMQGTGAWTNWNIDSAVILLSEGFVNTIQFLSTGSDFGNLDEITIKEKEFTEPDELPVINQNNDINWLKAMPNPFSESVSLHYIINEPCTASVMIYNSQGQLINSLVNKKHDIGDYYIEWNARNQNGELIQPGVYYCRIISNTNQMTIKLLYLGIN
jgi:rhamnogalacturonan endolyase